MRHNQLKAIACLVSAVGLVVFIQPTRADVVSRCKPHEFVKKIDNNTVICRTKFNSTTVFTLERVDNKSNLTIWLSIVLSNFRPYSMRLVTIVDKGAEDAPPGETSFWLNGRTFLEWNKSPNPELMNAYKADVSTLLDAIEEPPMRF